MQQQGEEPSGPQGGTRTSAPGCGWRSRAPWQLTAPLCPYSHRCCSAEQNSSVHQGSSHLTVSS